MPCLSVSSGLEGIGCITEIHFELACDSFEAYYRGVQEHVVEFARIESLVLILFEHVL